MIEMGYNCYCKDRGEECKYGPCSGCGDDHGSNPGQRCRDCDITYSLDCMQCSGCERMRYRTETPFGDIGGYLWGDPCVCDPRPPSKWEAAHAAE